MYEDCCIRHGCRMMLLENLPFDIPTPKFAIGQFVTHSHETAPEDVPEEGLRTYTYSGVVVGVYWAFPGDMPGWWYRVRCDVIIPCDWLDLPHDVEFMEEDLILVDGEAEQELGTDWVNSSTLCQVFNISQRHLKRLRSAGLRPGIHYRNIARPDAARPTYRYHLRQVGKLLNRAEQPEQ